MNWAKAFENCIDKENEEISVKEIRISGKDICKSFVGHGVENQVLNQVNVDIYAEDFTVIMGPSGAGKSTLLYVLSGMDDITSGKVFYKGQEINGYSEKQMAQLRAREFGFIFQQTHLVSNLTLLENVAVTGYLAETGKGRNIHETAEYLLDRMNVLHAKNRLPSQVSGGEAQRAAVARAIINNPGLLFADEPTGALNRRNTEEVLNLLTGLHESGQSILMVTHDLRSAIRGNRLLYLEDGQITGELSLKPFTPESAREREVEVHRWLTSMEW